MLSSVLGFPFRQPGQYQAAGVGMCSAGLLPRNNVLFLAVFVRLKILPDPVWYLQKEVVPPGIDIVADRGLPWWEAVEYVYHNLGICWQAVLFTYHIFVSLCFFANTEYIDAYSSR